MSRVGAGREHEAALLRTTDVPRLVEPARHPRYARVSEPPRIVMAASGRCGLGILHGPVPKVEDALQVREKERPHLQDAGIADAAGVQGAAGQVRLADHQTPRAAGSDEVDGGAWPREAERGGVTVAEYVDGAEVDQRLEQAVEGLRHPPARGASVDLPPLLGPPSHKAPLPERHLDAADRSSPHAEDTMP